MTESNLIWEYIRLDNTLSPSNFLERVSLYSSLYVQPVWSVLYWISWLLVPSLFVYLGGSYGEQDMIKTAMTIANTLHVGYSAFHRWKDMLRHYELGTTIMGWKLQTLRSPKIRIQSADPRHQFFAHLAALPGALPTALPPLPQTYS